MKGILHDEGRRLIAGMLAGSGRKVDGMYVEWTSDPSAAHDGVLRCTREYFAGLSAAKDRGFVRLRASNAYVGEDSTVHYSAMLTRDDLPKTRRRVYVAGVTLVSLGATQNEDAIVFSNDFEKPVQVSDGIYTTVHASIRLGAVK